MTVLCMALESREVVLHTCPTVPTDHGVASLAKSRRSRCRPGTAATLLVSLMLADEVCPSLAKVATLILLITPRLAMS